MKDKGVWHLEMGQGMAVKPSIDLDDLNLSQLSFYLCKDEIDTSGCHSFSRMEPDRKGSRLRFVKSSNAYFLLCIMCWVVQDTFLEAK